MKRISILAIAVLVIACISPAVTLTPTLEPPATPTLEPPATPTLEPPATPTPLPTPTPVPTNTPTRTPRPTATPTSTPAPPPTDTPVQVQVLCDVSVTLTGPAGDPAARNPQTNFQVDVRGAGAAQVAVESPGGETIIILQQQGDFFGWEQRFFGGLAGLPQPGGTYTCIALDASGAPIPGAVDSDVYLGGYEPDPPTDVQAELTEGGILVTWAWPRVIPGAFDPVGSPCAGHYYIGIDREGLGSVYAWAQQRNPLVEMSHLIPFRRQDFGPGDRGLPLEEMDDGVYHLFIQAASQAPEGTAGQRVECQARDPAQDVRFVIEGGQVRIEGP
jgi:hypothetical protein